MAKVTTPTEKQHATFSASASERYIACPGSISLSKGIKGRDSEYAQEGTDAHYCLEVLMQASPGEQRRVMKDLYAKYPEEMVNHACDARREILDRAEACGSDVVVLSETRVDSTWFTTEDEDDPQFGTVDAAIVDLFGRLEVIDYKYGRGVPVEPEDNTQMIYYALGLAAKYDFNFESVRLTVIQPRAEHSRGPIRSWDLSIKDLRAWAQVFRRAVQEAQSPDPKLAVGDWCRWCPAKIKCPEMADKALKQAQADFDDETGEIEVPAADVVLPLIPPEKLARMLKAFDRLEDWIKAVREYAFEQAKGGVTIPGFKLVDKRGIRKWRNVEHVTKLARKTFGDEAFSAPELLSPAQLEKRIGKDNETLRHFLDQHASMETSGLTLVPETDPREATNSAAKDFDDDYGKGADMPKKKKATDKGTVSEKAATKKVAKKPAPKKRK